MTARPRGRPPLVMAGVEVKAGKSKRIELPAPNLSSGSPLSMPAEVLHGSQEGPTIWLSGAIHGDELTGVEVIRRVLEKIRRRAIRGTIIAVPVVNVFGFIAGSRYLPDRRDLNRAFPGSDRGSLASQLAHLFMREVVSRSQYGIDLHTGADHRTNLPQIRADLDDAETLHLAQAFGAPIIVHAVLRDGSIREAAARKGARVLVFEGGEPHRFDEWAVTAGTSGVLRVLHALEMVGQPEDGEAIPENAPWTLPLPGTPRVCRSTHWTRAGRSGVARLVAGLGEEVTKGQSLGFISDSFGSLRVPVRAGASGVIIGMTRNPLVNRGDAIFHIARMDSGEESHDGEPERDGESNQR
ncbi:MAG: succinylglutamate desuccinylase/aspartoacylase family protein [Gemmatimonadota bacterium]